MKVSITIGETKVAVETDFCPEQGIYSSYESIKKELFNQLFKEAKALIRHKVKPESAR